MPIVVGRHHFVRMVEYTLFRCTRVAAMRDVLTILEALSDDELWKIARSTFPDEQYEQFAELREKRRAGTITEAEQTVRLAQEADLLTLRKAYAAVLLKWRGYKLPDLATLEAQP
ncbi:MAG: hypothetical protein ACJ8CR_10055 [Roseiflexaceae bacterium]